MSAVPQESEANLNGRVAIVTGAGARSDGIGNGRASAILLGRAGVKVVCVDRDLALATRTVEMIAEHEGEALAVQADVTSADACRQIVAKALDQYGALHILDNNVGIGSRASVVDEDPGYWQKVMDTNVNSMFLMGKYAVPAIADSGGGAIVNMASISARRPHGLTAYSTSKGAVIALTKAMAVDHAAQGIRVNCIAPGPVFTPMVDRDGQMTDAQRETRKQASVLGIEGTGWDVGNAVKFLVSDHARYITGQTLVVDGGVTLRGPERKAN